MKSDREFNSACPTVSAGTAKTGEVGGTDGQAELHEVPCLRIWGESFPFQRPPPALSNRADAGSLGALEESERALVICKLLGQMVNGRTENFHHAANTFNVEASTSRAKRWGANFDAVSLSITTRTSACTYSFTSFRYNCTCCGLYFKRS